MSMLSSWVKRQVRKKGAKVFILKILDIVVEATPSKKDDQMLAEIKRVMNKFNE